MAIKTSELTKLIADQVTKDVAKKLIPKLRRVVREEIDRSMKDMIYEMVMKNQMPLKSVDDEQTLQFEETRPTNVSDAKNFIAQRQSARTKAQQILEKKFQADDPFASLIMGAEDPQEEEDMKQERILAGPMKKVTEVSKGDVTMPENIDFTAAMDRLLPE
ncbi:MAG: hypothetical protein VX253_11555 [Bacteroidota bacterium]|nr:hypothetical protein [Bacteroidota bacterium]